jgi:broad specificity phosphatase PhoE
VSIIVLLKHGEIQCDETGSPTNHLAPGSCIEAIRMTEAALGAIPADARFPRPDILSAPEKEAAITAALIAKIIHVVWAIRAALAEMTDCAKLREFVIECIVAKQPIIAVSHESTINALVREFITIGAPYTNRKFGLLARYQGVVIDTEAKTINVIEAPPFFLFNT